MKRIFTLTALLCLFMMMGINAAVAQSFSAKWSYGTNGDTIPTISPSGIFEASDPALGSSMGYKNGEPSSASQTLGNIKVWQYTTTVSQADAIDKDYTDDRTIKYTLTPKSGTTLTPSQISFYACKIATGDEVKVKVVASVGSKSVTLTNGTSSDIALDRDNGSNFKYDLDVSGLTVDESNPLVITVYVKGKGFRAGGTDSNGKSISAKNLGFGEVTISGTYKAGSTSIKSSSEMTTSTSAPTTWNFSDVTSSKWTKTVSALNTNTSEWKKAESSDEWRPTTVCKNREYNLELINGLVFNTNFSGDLCLDNSNKQLSVAKGSSITIPGLSSGNYVRFTGSISGITTPGNATLISSDGSYLYKINSNGDVKFEIPSTIKDWGAWIKSIEVLASAPAVKQKVWIFDKTLDGSEGKGIGNGQTFSSDVWTSSTKDGVTSYSLANATKDDENGANLITADGTTVFRTDGISFICEMPGHLSVVPDNSLTLDGNGTIVLNDIASSVNKGASTYVLIEAEPVSGRAGFIVNSKKWNSNFVNQELTAASTRQTFMLKVTSQKNQQTVDVKIQPSAAMKIYRIEVTQKTIPTISATVTGKISAETTGDKTTYQASHGDSFTVTFNITESDLNGKFKVYAMDDNKIVSGNTVEQDVVSGKAGSATFNAKAVGGGEALFVAKFTPDATETKYTYGYATVSVDVADPTMYRVKNGESANVGDVISSVKGIKMYIDGWEGAPGAPKEYRSNGTADQWTKARKEAYIETFPGYDYTFSANENSADETLTQYANKFTANYNNDKYWYKENVNNPYSMPVFGGFLKFVPNENGTLKVYIHQNGALCQIRHKDGSQTINPFMVHTRSYYIADETGKLYTGTDGVTATTKAKWADVWNGTKIGDGLGNSLGKGSNDTKASFDDDDNTDYDAENKQYKADIAYWRARVKDINGNSEDNVDENLVQTIYNLDGGWVMLNEGASEYTFHVTAGKTYFVFTNRTKLGFYGFRFTPDENVTKVTIKPSAEEAKDYTLTKSAEPAAGASVAYKVDQSFKRELNAGMWNTLCLPFSLNEDQTKAALPEGFEIVDFYSVKNDKLTFKKHYYQMIDAGRPYLIWIPRTQGEKYDMKFPTGYVAYDDKTSGSSGLQPINVTGEDDSADKYVWTGTYQQMSLPKNAYFVAQNHVNGKTVIKQNVSGKSKTNGYRAYLVAASGETPVKALSIDYDGVDEEVTTGIDDIMADLTDPETTGKVYNLGGQLVSRNGLQSLPKGIYIMNGKKYVVK